MEEKLCVSCNEPVTDKYPACPLQCMSQKCKAYKKAIYAWEPTGSGEFKPVVNTSQKPVIWMLGGPGSGKGTQCKKIETQFGYTHLSTGDLLRAEVRSDSNRSTCIRNIMKRGALVPTDIVLDLLKENIKLREPTSNGFLVDGYPRNKMQGSDFERTICVANMIVYLEISPDTMFKRLQGRAATSPRIDDNTETIKLRIANFLENNNPILSQYAESGRLVMIDAEGTVDVVYNTILKYLQPLATSTKNALDAAIMASQTPIPLPPVPVTAKAAAEKAPPPK